MPPRPTKKRQVAPANEARVPSSAMQQVLGSTQKSWMTTAEGSINASGSQAQTFHSPTVLAQRTESAIAPRPAPASSPTTMQTFAVSPTNPGIVHEPSGGAGTGLVRSLHGHLETSSAMTSVASNAATVATSQAYLPATTSYNPPLMNHDYYSQNAQVSVQQPFQNTFMQGQGPVRSSSIQDASAQRRLSELAAMYGGVEELERRLRETAPLASPVTAPPNDFLETPNRNSEAQVVPSGPVQQAQAVHQPSPQGHHASTSFPRRSSSLNDVNSSLPNVVGQRMTGPNGLTRLKEMLQLRVNAILLMHANNPVQRSMELMRLGWMRMACEELDHEYLLLHFLFCKNETAPDTWRILQLTEEHRTGLQWFGRLLFPKNTLTQATLEWYASFPWRGDAPSVGTMAVLDRVKFCLSKLAVNFQQFYETSRRLEKLPSMHTMETYLAVTSPVLQRVIFRTVTLSFYLPSVDGCKCFNDMQEFFVNGQRAYRRWKIWREGRPPRILQDEYVLQDGRSQEPVAKLFARHKAHASPPSHQDPGTGVHQRQPDPAPATPSQLVERRRSLQQMENPQIQWATRRTSYQYPSPANSPVTVNGHSPGLNAGAPCPSPATWSPSQQGQPPQTIPIQNLTHQPTTQAYMGQYGPNMSHSQPQTLQQSYRFAASSPQPLNLGPYTVTLPPTEALSQPAQFQPNPQALQTNVHDSTVQRPPPLDVQPATISSTSQSHIPTPVTPRQGMPSPLDVQPATRNSTPQSNVPTPVTPYQGMPSPLDVQPATINSTSQSNVPIPVTTDQSLQPWLANLYVPLFPPRRQVAPEIAIPPPTGFAFHQAHLRDPLYASNDGSLNSNGMHWFSYLIGFLLNPCMIRTDTRMLHGSFIVSDETLCLLPDRTEDQFGAPPQCTLRPGSLMFRIRCVKARPLSNVSPEGEWTVAPTAWPDALSVNLNGKVLNIRRKEHHGKDLPIDISTAVQAGENTLDLAFFTDPGAAEGISQYVLAVELAEFNDLDAVRAMAKRIPASVTANRIRKQLASGDGDVQVLSDDLTIRLLDPFTAHRVVTPARGVSCLHFECFDLDIFLRTREGNPCMAEEFKCPICGCDARPRSLVLDEWFEIVLQELNRRERANGSEEEGATAISVNPQAAWKVKEEERNGEAGDGLMTFEASSATRLNGKGGAKTQTTIEVIELD